MSEGGDPMTVETQPQPVVGDGKSPLRVPATFEEPAQAPLTDAPVFQMEAFSAFYGTFRAVKDINLTIPRNRITAFIGPSGSGKSTLLRCFNRMNDLVPSSHFTGKVLYHDVDLYDPRVDPVEVRRRI